MIEFCALLALASQGKLLASARPQPSRSEPPLPEIDYALLRRDWQTESAGRPRRRATLTKRAGAAA